jgi:hypothetical protein
VLLVDAAWFAPPAVFVLAALGVAALLRRIGAAVEDVGGARDRARRIDGALVPVRVETRRARASIDRFHRR